MNYIVFLDASTLILLAKTDLLPILTERNELHISFTVNQEVLFKPERYDAQMIERLIGEERLHVTDDEPAHHVRRICQDFNLDKGEVASLLLARKYNAPIGTDDGVAIKAAKIMGIPFFTAIHVLIELSQKRRIPKELALAKVDLLGQVGRYSRSILDHARSRVEGR
jgi:predicted nucleic acid-binding protein